MSRRSLHACERYSGWQSIMLGCCEKHRRAHLVYINRWERIRYRCLACSSSSKNRTVSAMSSEVCDAHDLHLRLHDAQQIVFPFYSAIVNHLDWCPDTVERNMQHTQALISNLNYLKAALPTHVQAPGLHHRSTSMLYLDVN